MDDISVFFPGMTMTGLEPAPPNHLQSEALTIVLQGFEIIVPM